VLLNGQMEHMLQDQTYHTRHIKKSYEEEKSAMLQKIRDMREELISLKERRPLLT